MIFWGASQSLRWLLGRPCFNPCSIGMIFWGYGFYYRDCQFCYVSILVLLEWSSEVQVGASRRPPSRLFQSLFYWNDLLRPYPPCARAFRLSHVSILVLLEWSSEAIVSIGQHLPHLVSILVLLEWSSEVESQSRWEAIFSVSILVLLEWSSEGNDRQCVDRGGLHVSILVLLEWSSEGVVRENAIGVIKVSILVLLEWSSEGGYPVRWDTFSSFQSLFWWNDLLRIALRDRHPTPVISFNPCSDGMIFWGVSLKAIRKRP